jgi:hypothetical protein
VIELPRGTMSICALEQPLWFVSRRSLDTSMELTTSALCYTSGPLSVARLEHGAFVLVLRSCFASGSIRACAMEKKFDTLQNHSPPSLPRDRFGRAHKTSATRSLTLEMVLCCSLPDRLRNACRLQVPEVKCDEEEVCCW